MAQIETAPAGDAGAALILFGNGSESSLSEFERNVQCLSQRFDITRHHARMILRLIRGEIYL